MAEVLTALGGLSAAAQLVDSIGKITAFTGELCSDIKNGGQLVSEKISAIDNCVDAMKAITLEPALSASTDTHVTSCLQTAFSIRDTLQAISTSSSNGPPKAFKIGLQWNRKKKEIIRMCANLEEKKSTLLISVQSILPLIHEQLVDINRSSPEILSKVSAIHDKVVALGEGFQPNTKPQFGKREPHFSTICLERMSPFVGRKNLLERLRIRLNMSGRHNRVALFGLAGVGKTELAREYVIRLKEKAPRTSIIWIQANSTLQFEQDYLKIARYIKELGQAPGDSEKTTATIARIRSCLCTKEFGEWLIIVDNANDEAALFDSNSMLDLIPMCPFGSVLFTTRNKKMGLRLIDINGNSGDNVIEVKGLDPVEAKRLLLIRTGSNKLNDDDAKASELVAALEHLPLAISQAGGFIAMNSMPVAGYLRLYNSAEQSKIELLDDDNFGSQSWNSANSAYSAPVATTLAMSLDKMRESDQDASNLLSFMACLATRRIPKQLLSDAQHWSEIKLVKALATLSSYCLITETETTEGSFDVHGLVYIVVRNWLRSTNSFDFWAGKSFVSIASRFPVPGQSDSLQNSDAYLLHAETVLSYAQASTVEDTERAELAYRCSRYLLARGRYARAETFANRAVDWRIHSCGEHNVETLTMRSYLATLLRYQGQYQDSRDTDKDVLARGEKVFGSGHPFTICCMENLALTLSRLGQHQEAEKLHRRVLEQRAINFGSDDHRTLASMHNLVGSLIEQKRWIEARDLGSETIRRKRIVLGEDNLDTLLSLNNLAIVLYRTGELDEAERNHRIVLEGRLKSLGREHPLVFTSKNHIGVILHKKGQLAAAEEKYREALDGAREFLGMEHDQTITIAGNLLDVLSEQGRHDEAATWRQEMLADSKDVPSVGSSRHTSCIKLG